MTRPILHFTNARLIDPESLSDAQGSLTLAGGVIQALNAPPEGPTILDCGGKCLAPGIVDLGVRIGEPVGRHRESFRSAGLAAEAGGVTTIIARGDILWSDGIHCTIYIPASSVWISICSDRVCDTDFCNKR